MSKTLNLKHLFSLFPATADGGACLRRVAVTFSDDDGYESDDPHFLPGWHTPAQLEGLDAPLDTDELRVLLEEAQGWEPVDAARAALDLLTALPQSVWAASLTSLSISSIDLAGASMRHLTQWLNSDSCSLQRLELERAGLGPADVAALGTCRVEELVLPSLSDAAVRVVCESLAHNHHLRVLRLRFARLDKDSLVQLAASLEVNTTLEALDLLGHGHDTAPQAALHLAEVVRRASSLRELYLSMRRFTDAMLEPLFDALSEPGSSLRKLDLWCNSITRTGLEQLVQAIISRGGLDTLVLSRNNIGDSLSTLVPTPVRELILRGVRMSTADAEALAAGLSDSRWPVELLDLSMASLSDASLSTICEGLLSNHTLTTLRARATEITSVSMMALSRVVCHGTLQHLDVSCTDLRDTGVEQISNALTSPNCRLRELRIFGCNASSRALQHLGRSLLTNSTLESLSAGVPNEPEVVDEFYSALQHNFTLCELDVDGGSQGPHRARLDPLLERNRQLCTDGQAAFLVGVLKDAAEDGALKRFAQHATFDLNVMSHVFGFLDGKRHVVKFNT